MVGVDRGGVARRERGGGWGCGPGPPRGLCSWAVLVGCALLRCAKGLHEIA